MAKEGMREVLVHFNVEVGEDNGDAAAGRIAVELIRAAARDEDRTAFDGMIALVDPT